MTKPLRSGWPPSTASRSARTGPPGAASCRPLSQPRSDKDLTAALLAEAVGADALLLLTDVEAVLEGYETAHPRPLRHVTPGELRIHSFPAGSMGPKVEVGCRFAELTGGFAAIGRLDDAAALLAGAVGTIMQDTSSARG